MTTGTWNSFGAGIEAEVVRRAHCSTARDQLAGGTGRRESRGQDWAAVSIALIACVTDRLVAHSNCEQHLLARLMKVELSSIFGLRRGDEMRHEIWNPLTWPPNRSVLGLGKPDSTEPQEESGARCASFHWEGSCSRS